MPHRGDEYESGPEGVGLVLRGGSVEQRRRLPAGRGTEDEGQPSHAHTLPEHTPSSASRVGIWAGAGSHGVRVVTVEAIVEVIRIEAAAGIARERVRLFLPPAAA